MTDGLQGLAQEAKKNKLTGINSKISEDDVVSIWDAVASYIDKMMSQQKGVSIPGLGTFTFTQKKIDVGNNKFLLIQRPVFAVAEKFSQTHQLSCTKYHLTGQVSVVPLNFAALSFETPFDRDTVESCVREVLTALSRSVADMRNIEFTFTGIGRLTIRDRKVKMKFYKEFINCMDGSGTLVKAMSNRPGTMDSVMSDRPNTRPHTSNTIVLPRIGASGNKDLMPMIPEDGVPDETGSQVLDVDAERQASATGERCEEGGEDKQAAPPTQRGPSRQALNMARASALSFHDDLLVPPTPQGVLQMRRSSPGALIESVRTPRQLEPLADRPTPPRSADAIGQMQKPTPPPIKRATSEVGLHKMPTPPQTAGSMCGHNAGQELCYLCHQRALRNVPVSFTEERSRREEEENRLLQQYNMMKDTEAVLQDTSEKVARRHDLQKQAAFNLGVAEAVKDKKTERDMNFYRSYIFMKRPLTPARFHKQNVYFTDLNKQVQGKDDSEKRQKEDERFLERLEQVQLAEDLSAQREQYIKDKLDQRDQLRRALSAQVRFKPAQLPAREPDSDEPIFGKDDMTTADLIMRRQKAQEILADQKESVAQKKREAILRQVEDQAHEEKVLDKSKRDLLADRAGRFQRMMANRQRLEGDWKRAAQDKRKRELEDKLRTVSPGALMHEQCDKYHKCGQCKRRLNNCGETNVWSDTRYIPGTRLMV